MLIKCVIVSYVWDSRRPYSGVNYVLIPPPPLQRIFILIHIHFYKTTNLLVYCKKMPVSKRWTSNTWVTMMKNLYLWQKNFKVIEGCLFHTIYGNWTSGHVQIHSSVRITGSERKSWATISNNYLGDVYINE